ncbi:MAG: efflux RND transporter permease subunit [Pseudomonadota bacterium]
MIRFFAAHPTAANLLMIAFLVVGLFALPNLQRETFPRIEPRKVSVTIAYPGARPEDVEQAVCRRIEDAVDGVDNITEVLCNSREALATAEIEMIEGGNLDRFFSDVKTEIEAINDFPDNVETPIIRQLGRTDFVASVAVTGPEDKIELKAYAEDVKRRMLQWGGIPKIEIEGFSDHQIRIVLKDAVLRQLELSISDIANTISKQSLDLPAGNIQSDDSEILIRFTNERKQTEEFQDLVIIGSEKGGQVLLGDIAEITDRFELDEEKFIFNGKPAALLRITKTEYEDTLNVIDAVNAFLKHERAIVPPGVALTVTNDVSSVVRDRLELLIYNMSQGLFLVFLAMWLFFGLRYSFWITMGLPVAFMGAFAVMVFIGYSINMLTMVALLIVIGLLMDDAIVISENIASQLEKGKPPLQAAIDGCYQVLPGVFSSFATTICIFGSLAFLKGDIGAILSVVPIVMLCVLVVSLVEAFLILPNHLSHSLQDQNSRAKLQVWAEDSLSWMRENIVGKYADATVKWRYLTTGVTVGLLLLAVSAMAGGLVKFSAFPDIDGDTLQARILLPQGTPLAKTKEVVAKVTTAIRNVGEQLQPNETANASLIKNISVQYNKNSDANESGSHIATVTADLLSNEVRNSTNDEILSLWLKKTGDLPDVIFIKFAESTMGPAGLAIDLRLQGNNLEDLKQASVALQNWLRQYQGSFNISDDLRPGKPEIQVRLAEGAKSLGVDANTVADQLRKAFYGSTASEIQLGSESYEIDVRLNSEDKNSISDLEQFHITTSDGSLIPLSAIANLSQARGYAKITRIDGMNTVSVQGDVDTRIANANEIVLDTTNRFIPQLKKQYPDIKLAIQGQNNEAGKTQGSMINGFIIGLIGVFLLLSFQFRSYVEPIVVMVVIPFAFIGAIIGHILLGLDFTMPSMLGFIALAGVVVNDSILLVNFIKDRHTPDVTVADVAPLASRARFRAIFLTSLTTVLGLLPMLLETSLQAQILIPLVTSLAFGLIASTLLVLFVVPAIYSILDDFGLSTLSDANKNF